MNVESLKTELQQVLDNDVVLRKEFNELKRSLSDYRNQLIMRDEDCKRLQVTIDVLNTKLAVMERDNTNYKAELTSFKELRGTIKEQLQDKQDEIDARLNEIQVLKDDLNAIAVGYEQKIEELKADAKAELERVRVEYTEQLNELKTNASYKENGLRDEFENRLSELTAGWADKEHGLLLNHEEALVRMRSQHETEISALKAGYDSTITDLSSGSRGEIEAINEAHRNALTQLEFDFNARYSELESRYNSETGSLKTALEEQRSTLTSNFNAQIESLKAESITKASELIASYEKQIEELRSLSNTSNDELSRTFTAQLDELRASHEQILGETINNHQGELSSVIAGYEEKLSHALIHSNSQNSKLSEELDRVNTEFGASLEKIRELTANLESRNSEISELSSQVSHFELMLTKETNKFTALNEEFEAFRQNSLLSNSEQVNDLNAQIANLNLAHSDYVGELNGQIEGLNTELRNLGLLFESTTNTLSETEAALEQKVQELATAEVTIEGFKVSLVDSSRDLENFKAQIQEAAKLELENRETEFQKLLVENSSLISEIDEAQDKIEAQEDEIKILKAEIDALRTQNAGKTEDFKETISNKNFEITNLEANNAALCAELNLLKKETTGLQEQLEVLSQNDSKLESLQNNLNLMNAENANLVAEMNTLQGVVSGLNQTISVLNDRIALYETEIGTLKNETANQEHEAFIDRLFKQIDGLNDQRLALLDEKEQMAAQLLKMNDVIGSISQQVDSENINVEGLNNHRKNVILASNLGETSEKSQMKEQINDLVREIDKCIALLSA